MIEKKKKTGHENIIQEHIVKKSKVSLFLIIFLVIALASVAVWGLYKCGFFNNEKSEEKNEHSLGEIYYDENKEDSPEKSEEEKTQINNNSGYLNVSGLTVKEWCEENNMTFGEFKENYGLPDSLTEDTYYDVAYYMMPVGIIAATENTDFVTLKEKYRIPDVIELQIEADAEQNPINITDSEPQYSKMTINVNETTPWGIIYDELLIEDCIEVSFDVFKAEYGFGDEITPKTKMKEVRPVMEKVKIENRDKKNSSEEETVVTEEVPENVTTEDVVTESNAVSEELQEETMIPDTTVEQNVNIE